MEPDDPSFPYWFPQQVEFRYLQSNATVYRQPCTETYSDVIVYEDYFIHANQTEKLDSSNAGELYNLDTPEQALEYLLYFIFQGGDTGGIGTIPTVDAYTSYEINCEISTDSPIRFLRITQLADNSTKFEMNVDDNGSIQYQIWKFEPNSVPVLTTKTEIGRCP
jgi:hypothetical protein